MRLAAAWITRRPVPAYFVMTFAVSWVGFLAAIGPGGMHDAQWQTDARFPFAVMAMLAGPTVACVVLTAVLDGRAGFRDLGRRLIAWKVHIRWYAVALLPAPLLSAAVLLGLSLSSPIFSRDDTAIVIVSGLAAGATTVFEELGWTGFAVPRLRQRHGVLSTGLIVGVLWGAWHFLQSLFISGTYAGGLPLLVFAPLNFLAAVAQLTAYRVLLVWLYERTTSLLVVTLMHGSLTASNIFWFAPETTGTSFLTFVWLSAVVWIAVAAIVGRQNGVRS